MHTYYVLDCLHPLLFHPYSLEIGFITVKCEAERAGVACPGPTLGGLCDWLCLDSIWKDTCIQCTPTVC